MSVTALPAPMHVRDLLSDLLGREVTVGTGTPVASTRVRPAAIAVFADDRQRTVVVALLDLPLCGAAGGALGLLPQAGVTAMVEDNDLSEVLLENLDEVVNILSVLFNVPGAPHAKLHKLYAPGDLLPNEVRAYASVLGFRLDLAVAVAGYGSGRLSIISLR